MELFEPQKQALGQGEKTLLVTVELPHNRHIHNAMAEFSELANSSGVAVIQNLKVVINSVNAKYFIGSGKVEELSQIVKDLAIVLIIFSCELSPSQERNLEKALECQVLGRTGLILDIFSLRARSFDGKLQVELAQLRHLSTRLIRGWTHLERQKGGIGLRGPGETQLETDKRLITVRIKNITKRLEKVHKQRDLGRKLRIKNQLPMIALAGYTNAGKSTLFNSLTAAKMLVDNRLFATLDATLRRVILPASGKAMVADTVGFIQDLPHELVAAFKSTLEETRQANIILHVVDASDKFYREKIDQVAAIIADIDADKIPHILVMNKIDCLPDFKPKIDLDSHGKIYRVWISAQNNLGIDLLYQALAEHLSGMMKNVAIQLEAQYGYIRSEIYDIGYIRHEKMDDFGRWTLEISVTEHYLSKILNKRGVKLLWEKTAK